MAVSSTPNPKVPCKHSHFSSRAGKVKRGPHTELSKLSFSPWIDCLSLPNLLEAGERSFAPIKPKKHKKRPELQAAGGGLETDAGTLGTPNPGMQLRNGMVHNPTRVPRE